MDRSLERARSKALAPAVGVLSLVAALLTAGCGETGAYTWFQALPAQAAHPPTDYLISVGDVLSIRVLGHDEMTLRQRVRGDGRIALFLIGEVEARGKKPSALKAELEARLKEFIVAASVVVNVEEAQPIMVTLLGEVAKPGALQLDQDARLSRALAMGGGLTEFASRSGIFVVRQAPQRMRVRFKYDDILRNNDGAGDFPLLQGDLVEVE